jgi:hypothetical protein
MLVIPSASEGPRHGRGIGQDNLCDRPPFERSLGVYAARDDPREEREDCVLTVIPSGSRGIPLRYLEASYNSERSEL